MEYPLSDAKEFLASLRDYYNVKIKLSDSGRDIFYRYKEDGFEFSELDPRVSHHTILNDLSYEELTDTDKEKYLDIKKLIEEEVILGAKLKGHRYLKWFFECQLLENALNKYLEKMVVPEHGYSSDHDITVFIRNVSTRIIEYYDRENNSGDYSDYILTKSKKDKLINLSKLLQKEMQDLTDIVANNSQLYLTDYLGEFIESLEETASTGLAAKKNHEKLNREILIKSLSSDFYERYDDIPVDVIFDIVMVVDIDIAERKVFEIVSKVRKFLYDQKQIRYL